jgi:ribonuclease T2
MGAGRGRPAAAVALLALAAIACEPSSGGGPGELPGAAEAGQSLPAPRDGRWPFDYWVLALSWSPTHCSADGMAERDAMQCAGPRGYSFVVHGLWPQFEQGYPRSCPARYDAPDRRDIDAMLDIMPSRRLVAIQWERHGTCSGLDADAFLATTRAARARVRIPARFQAPPDWQQITAGDIEAAFASLNPGLTRDMMAVEARGPRLREVRICLDHALAFRPCAEVDQDGVGPDRLLRVPPVRGP